MKCPECGKDCPTISFFCEQCGKQLKDEHSITTRRLPQPMRRTLENMERRRADSLFRLGVVTPTMEAPTILGRTLAQMVDEIRRLHSRWEIIAFCGAVRLLGDKDNPTSGGYLAFLPGRWPKFDRSISNLIGKLIVLPSGNSLLRTQWIFTPVQWSDFDHAKRLARQH